MAISAKEGAQQKKFCGLSRLTLFGEKLSPDQSKYEPLGTALAESFGNDFMPPAPLRAVNKDEVDLDSLTFNFA